MILLDSQETKWFQKSKGNNDYNTFRLLQTSLTKGKRNVKMRNINGLSRDVIYIYIYIYIYILKIHKGEPE